MKHLLTITSVLFLVVPLTVGAEDCRHVPPPVAVNDFYSVAPDGSPCLPFRENDRYGGSLPSYVETVEFDILDIYGICGSTGDHHYKPNGDGVFDLVYYTIANECHEDTAIARVVIEPQPHPLTRIFEDDFEAGPPPAWDGIWVPGCGRLDVTERAALQGRYGLEVTVDESSEHAYLVDDSPEAEITYNSSFLLNPNSIEMSGNDGRIIFSALAADGDDWKTLLQIRLRRSGSQYQLRLDTYLDNGTLVQLPATGWADIDDEPLSVRLRLHAATGRGAGNGEAELSINGTTVGEAATLANGQAIVERVRFGLAGGTDPTEGVFYLDYFRSWS
ncbi:MAG: hypothetical protein GY719_06765 [bacterium]|nr:hypothetical protein [bacterium]